MDSEEDQWWTVRDTETIEGAGIVNDTIRIVFAPNPPDAFNNCPSQFPTLNPTVQCPFPGWCVEILSMMLGSLKLKVEPVIAKNAIGALDWGTFTPNGTWVGVLGYLTNGTADGACLLYQRTDLRDTYFEYSYPITNSCSLEQIKNILFYVQPIYVVRRQKENIGSVLWNAFKPYTTVTWLVILGALVAQMIAMIIIARVEVAMKKRKHTEPLEIIWNAMELQLDECNPEMHFRTIAGNLILYVFALLQSGFIIKLYEGLLLSALLAPPDSNPFKDADGVIKLVGEGKYHLVTNYLGNWYFDELRNSNASHYVKLRKATANNPVVQAASVSAALDLVEQGNYIFPIQEDAIALQMSKERCNLVYISDGLPQVTAHFLFNNNSKYLPLFNKAIIYQSMFVQRTFAKYLLNGFKIADIPKCDSSEFDSNTQNKSLDINSTIGIFTMAAIGISFGMIAFVAEIYFFWHNRIVQYRRKTRSALGEVSNLLAIARIHFTTENYNSVDVVKLAEIFDNMERDEKIPRDFISAPYKPNYE